MGERPATLADSVEDQPRYSDDGKLYWNGQVWVPVTPPAQPAAPVQVTNTVRVRPARWRYWFWTILIGGIALLFAWAALASSQH